MQMHPTEIATALANLQQMTLAIETPPGESIPGIRLQQMTLAVQTPQSEFIPGSQLPTEVLPATPFVFIAYAFVWVALIGYLFGLWRKLTRVERELAQVATRVEGRRTP
jgi:CcmD family protein